MFETIHAVSGIVPFISLLLLTLPIGAALMWLVADPAKARWIALCAALIDLCMAVAILLGFESSRGGFQFVEHASWIPTLNVR